ncbi:MAG: CDP-2,3-bis-(O-geranylgeranyl)-sn-glycerol synthase [Candidatus Thorarchaeota archaeon]
MYEEAALVELALWFGLPAWIANATPVIFGGGRPIDGGRLFLDGRRLLGDGKTVRGFVAGVFFGTLTGAVQELIAPFVKTIMMEFVTLTAPMEVALSMTVPIALAMSIGALFGDMIGSFVKRRIGIRSGGPAPVLDQLGFILMALILASPVVHLGSVFVLVLVTLTLLTHYVTNVMGYLLGYKRNPW